MSKSNGARAVILMGHGSRVPGAGDNMERVAQGLRARVDFSIVETCYMSRLGRRFPEALQRCVAAGAREVMLIPYFLNEGLHIRLDIPEMMKHEAEKYPDVRLVFGKNLGFDELLVDLVRKRIDESQGLCDVRDLALEPKEAFALPPGEKEFVAMSREEAERYRREHAHGDAHDH